MKTDIRIEIKGLKDDCFKYFDEKIDDLVEELNCGNCDGANVYHYENKTKTDRYEYLTNRQKQVLGLTAHGYSQQQIADKLGITIPTVFTHIDALKDKLKLSLYDRKPKELAIMIYWQNNIEELKSVNLISKGEEK